MNIFFLKLIVLFIFPGELQDWATAGETEEKMEMNTDFEQNRGYGYGANPNVVSEAPPSYDEVSQPLQQGPAQPSANPFTSGQNNPFRQWKCENDHKKKYFQQWNSNSCVNGMERNKDGKITNNYVGKKTE